MQRRKGEIYLTEYRVQRAARSVNKGFLSDQCQEIEKNN